MPAKPTARPRDANNRFVKRSPPAGTARAPRPLGVSAPVKRPLPPVRLAAELRKQFAVDLQEHGGEAVASLRAKNPVAYFDLMKAMEVLEPRRRKAKPISVLTDEQLQIRIAQVERSIAALTGEQAEFEGGAADAPGDQAPSSLPAVSKAG